ncbi:MAG: hypothetical protein AABX52_01500 [Nanoarchaeota archaeon]
MKGGRREELDKEITSYLASRKRSSWIYNICRVFLKRRPKHKTMSVVQPKPQQKYVRIQHKPEPQQQNIEEFEDMSPGVWVRMAGFFSRAFGKEEELEDMEFAPDVDFIPPDEVLQQTQQVSQTLPKMNKQSQQLGMQRPHSQQPQRQTIKQEQPRITVYDDEITSQIPMKKKWSLFSWRQKKEEAVTTPKQDTHSELLITQAEQESYDTKEDMREVTKIFLKTLERLPPEELGRFKRSEDFDRLKILLKKHSVIK